jgi:hypothetical protein
MFYLTLISVDPEQVDLSSIPSHYLNLQNATSLGPLVNRTEGLTQSFYEERENSAYLKRKDGIGFVIRDGAIDEFSELPDDQICVIDVGPKSITTRADKFGVRPVFFGKNSSGTRAGVSSDAHALAISLGLTRLNKISMLELLRYGHCVGRESTISGISRLWPDEVLTLEIQKKRISVKISQSNGFLHYDREDSNNQNRSEEAFSALKNGILDILKEPKDFACQISGGLDSRLTLGVLAKESDVKVGSLHVSLSNLEEISIAEQVASALGAEHLTLNPSSPSWELFDRGWILTSGQVSGLSAAGNLTCHDYLIKRGVKYLVGGWPGDCLIGSYIPNDRIFLAKFFRKIGLRSWEIQRGYSLIELARLCGPRILFRDLTQTRKRLKKILAENEFETATRQISWWAMFRRQPTFSYISPSNFSTKVFEITPLLTRRYIEILLTLSSAEIINKNFYRKLIWSHFPNLRHIPYHASGLPINPDEIIPRGKFNLRKIIQAIFCHEYFEILHMLLKGKLGRRKTFVSSLETNSWLSLCSPNSQEAMVISGKSFKPWKVQDPENRVHFLGVLHAVKKSEDYLFKFKHKV